MIAATPPLPPPLSIGEARAAIVRYQHRQRELGHLSSWRFTPRAAERVNARRVRVWTKNAAHLIVDFDDPTVPDMRAVDVWTSRLEVRRTRLGVRVEWLIPKGEA